MSPITHFLASWTVAESCTEAPRERLWICLAGLMPDLDGLGVGVDLANQFLGHEATHYFFIYHHFVLHGIFGALLIVAIAPLAGVLRLKALFLVFASFHLHLWCDFVGARGPTRDDLWVIHYFGPFTRKGTIWWTHQWPLNGWQNILITVLLLTWIIARSIRPAALLYLCSARVGTVSLSPRSANAGFNSLAVGRSRLSPISRSRTALVAGVTASRWLRYRPGTSLLRDPSAVCGRVSLR